jgi:predicted transcriptional regulator
MTRYMYKQLGYTPIRGPGERLSEWRRRHRMLQRTLAYKIGATQAMVSDYETGKKRPSSVYMARLQVVTGIPMIDWHPEAEDDVRAA